MIYLDNNATTKVDEEVLNAMLPYLKEEYGNPSSTYSFGKDVKEQVNKARENVSKLLNCNPDNIIFTSCGSESNVTAIMNAIKLNPNKKHIITTKVEHASIIETMGYLEREGYDITFLDVDDKGNYSFPKKAFDNIYKSDAAYKSSIGEKKFVDKYSQADKLQIAKAVLKDIEPMLITRGKTYRGTKAFSPYRFKDKFRDSIQLNVTIPAGGNQEFGVSMRTPREPKYALDLSSIDWYAYNDNYGTSEEKALVKYIEGIMPKLEEKYDEIYLVRNENDIKIYSFDTGQAFEPDFLLFLRIKGSANKYDNMQIFIEPKGDGLLKQDKWKNDFLKQIKTMADITYCTRTDDFHVWGIPFFNESTNEESMILNEKLESEKEQMERCPDGEKK